MRKYGIITILLILLSALAFNASAAEESHPHKGDHCVCGGSAVGVHEHVCESIQWKAMPTDTKNLTNLSNGNYYLTQDLTVTAISHLTNKKLTICLNGYDLGTTAGAVFGYVKAGCVINFCDCSGTRDGDGNWTWNGTVTANRTGSARDFGGVFNLCANGLANIYGGNFVGASGGKASHGGIFNVCNDSYATAGGTSNTDSSLHTQLTIYNGHFTGGNVSSCGGIINTWHSVYVDIYGGTMTGGTAKTEGNLKFSAATTVTLENCVITKGTPSSVLIMNGTQKAGQYSSLKDALAKLNAGQHIRLLGDINEAVTVSNGVCIDLAGNDLAGVTVSNGAVFIDSATNNYDSSITGKLTPASGAPVITNSFNSKHYLAVEENGSYSFHRYYAGITKITIKPGTVGMGYKATFAGSDRVKAALSKDVAYGYRMWLNEDNKLTRGYSADRFGTTQELTLRIDNYLSTQLTDAENEDRANQKVYACPYIRLADGTYIEGTTVSYSFREMLEKANTGFDSYSQTQQAALQNLSSTYSGCMLSWDVSHIHHADGSIWQKMTNTSFNKLLSDNRYSTTSSKVSCNLPTGNYVLTENVNIGVTTMRVRAGNTVNICLNGYTLTGSVRMFNTYGTINICDCHSAGSEGAMVSTLNVSETASNYAPIVYCYYGSVTNLYGGTLKATGKITKAGVVAVSHDGTDKTKPAAVFNMYGGCITGGNTYGEGGNISLWNGCTFNMYGGTISGGNSAKYGGSLMITSACTFNMYGGTVEGGTAATYGGNIYSNGTLNFYGGTVKKGTSTGGKGGNIYASGGQINIQNSTITGGKAPTATDASGNAVYSTGCGGGIYTNTATYISGNTVIDGNENGNLFMKGLAQVNIDNLGNHASIGISGDTHGFISGDPAITEYVFSEQADYDFCTVNNKVLMKKTDYDPSFEPSVSTFSVGYAMTSIQPTEAGLTMSAWGNPNGRKTDGSVGFELYATTIAITDEQNNTILMITVDLQGPSDTFHKNFRSHISAATGVPEENIYISATHTHNCPSLTTSSDGNARYLYMLTDQLVISALDAMADRAPATMQTGSFDTVGMNWTRHYYYIDDNGEKVYFGDQFGPRPDSATVAKSAHVRDGDTTMHMLAFERTGKDPVLVVNWRAHPHRSGGNEKYSVDSDVIGATREYIHSNTDYLFAYFQGAAGNMNTTSRLPGETYKSGKIKEYGDELGRQIVNGMAKLKSAETGLIQTKSIIYTANVDHTQDEKYEDAVALKNYYYDNPVEMKEYDNQIAKAAEFGFTSVFHATRLIAKYDLPATKNMELNIFSIGDSIGFYTAPAELWDSFSEENEQLSPFETTFCIGYCNGSVAYIPYKLDYFVSYEYFYCLFTQEETIEQMQEYYIENLEEQYENAQ